MATVVATATADHAGASTATVAKPNGTAVGDVIVVTFFMNGDASPPAGWVVESAGDNMNVVAYARVDGVAITAANDGQTFVFTDGGSALYAYSTTVVIRGARATGSPFDGGIAVASDVSGSSTETAPVSLTTTHDNTLLVLATNTVFSDPRGASAVSSPLSLNIAGSGTSHLATGTLADAGPSGDIVLEYDGETIWNFALLIAVRSTGDESASGHSVGRMGDGLRKSMNRVAETSGLDAQRAANVWADTDGLALVGALNVKGGVEGWGIKKILNWLAAYEGDGSMSGVYGAGEYGDGIYGGIVTYGDGEYGEGYFGGTDYEPLAYGEGEYGDGVYGGGITAAEGRWITGKWLDAAGAASQIQ